MEKHKHNFSMLTLIPINKVQRNYKGSPGDKSLLARKCTCGKYRAFDMGKTETMKELGQQLK